MSVTIAILKHISNPEVCHYCRDIMCMWEAISFQGTFLYVDLSQDILQLHSTKVSNCSQNITHNVYLYNLGGCLMPIPVPALLQICIQLTLSLPSVAILTHVTWFAAHSGTLSDGVTLCPLV